MQKISGPRTEGSRIIVIRRNKKKNASWSLFRVHIIIKYEIFYLKIASEWVKYLRNDVGNIKKYFSPSSSSSYYSVFVLIRSEQHAVGQEPTTPLFLLSKSSIFVFVTILTRECDCCITSYRLSCSQYFNDRLYTRRVQTKVMLTAKGVVSDCSCLLPT